MTSKEGYDVLRLIEHNHLCYVSSDYVRGQPVIKWLKYHPSIPKKKLFVWIQAILRQLEQFHKCRGNPNYQYVNPYSVIVMEDEQICLLDMNAASNDDIKKVMLRRNVREYFLPPQEPYYQKANVGLDIYGFGKTLQYLLSVSEVEPSLSRNEVRKFQNIIAKCSDYQSKKSYQTIQEIQKHIPKIKRQNSHISRRFKILLCTLAGFIVVLGLAKFLPHESQQTQKKQTQMREKPDEESNKYSEDKEEQRRYTDEAKLKFETGLVYFVEAQDYKKSLRYFRESEKYYELSKQFAVIAEFMAGGGGNKSILMKALEQAESLIPDKDDIRYYQCLMRGYTLLSDQESSEGIIRLGEESLKKVSSQELPDAGLYMEMSEYMAAAYEKQGENDRAVELYETQLDMEKDKEKKADIYRKIIGLYLDAGENGRAWDICERGTGEIPENMELKLLYIKMQCGDPSVDRSMCAETIRRYAGEQPEILESEGFQKLVNEYEIHVEGDQIWVGDENGPS